MAREQLLQTLAALLTAQDARWLEEHRGLLWGMAMDWYAKHGRGHVLIDFQQHGAQAFMHPGYVHSIGPTDMPTPTTVLVREYQPGREWVVVLHGHPDDPDSTAWRPYKMSTPHQAT